MISEVKMMLVKIIAMSFQVYTLMLFARILSSWVPDLQGTKFMRFIAFYTDPYLNIFRRIIPPLGMIDISPIFAFLALEFGKNILIGLLV
jgi:YggT family protein